MRSIELTFGDDGDAAILADWAELSNAGLESLAHHPGSSNRPHVTLAAGLHLADSPGLRASLAGLPLRVRFGGLVVFGVGRRSFVLARQVVASKKLLALHAAVHEAAPGAVELTLPGHWTPHVTIARRLSAESLALALPLLGALPPAEATAARLWDGMTKQLTPLT
ncbi:MAG: hypothetical protein JWL94_1295 [Microbacteriaceae bacterium]|jgi:2'-5' RNA ligase|nr:hypothetical protein [Microbacteriaceae bacterium]HEV7957795.1 2'-5' RNA ligase family protein [Marisediminicola sp.]